MAKTRDNSRLYNLSLLFMLLSFGMFLAMPVIYPTEFMKLCSIPDNYSDKVIIASTVSSSLCFIIFCMKIILWIYRTIKSFKKLSTSQAATVSVEFILVIPVILCLILTVFAMAEISQAQIMFRYAAYTAMRRGIIANYNHNYNIFKYKFTLSDEDKKDIKLAAAIALSALDTRSVAETTTDTLETENLATIYTAIAANTKDWKYKIPPWKNKKQVSANILTAYSTLDVTKLDTSRNSSKIILPISVNLQLEYKFPLRPGSLFWLIAPEKVNDYPCITLKRTCDVDSDSVYTMFSFGQRYDLPRLWFDIRTIIKLFPIYKSISIVPGDSVRNDIK